MSLERPIRRLDFRVFQHATEDRTKVAGALRFVSGSEQANESRAEGYHGNTIIILEVSLTGRTPIDEFWARVRDAGLCAGIEENLEERINDEGELFIRFDKQEAVSGRLGLSSGDDVVLARGRVLATVKGQEVRADRAGAVEVMRAFLTELEKNRGAGETLGSGVWVQGSGETQGSGDRVQGSGPEPSTLNPESTLNPQP